MENVLSAEQRQYLDLISPGATTLEDGIAALRREMSGIYGDEMSDRVGQPLSGSFQRAVSGDLDQKSVSALFADPSYCVNNARNNIEKIADPDMASLRMSAVFEMAAHAEETLLDFGCGGGAQLLALRALGCRKLWAAEVDDGLLGFVSNRYRFRFHETIGTWNILTGDVPPAQFGAVLVLDVFPVIAEPARTVELLKRVLRPGGLVVYNSGEITEKARANWSYLIGRSPQEIDENFASMGFSPVRRETFGRHDLVCKRLVG